MRALFVVVLSCVAGAAGCSGDSADGGTGRGIGPGNGTMDPAMMGGTSGGGAGDFGNGMNAGSGAGGVMGTGDPPKETVCAEGSANVKRVVPTVTLVIDGSCSMSSAYPGTMEGTSCADNAGSRWNALKNALLDPVTGVVTRLEGFVKFGVVVYGTRPECPLTQEVIEPALDNAAAITTAYPVEPPGLFTPTGEALDWVFDNTADQMEVLDFDLGPQIVLLATDGAPNSCAAQATSYGASIAAANKGQMKGVKMFVVSLAAASGEFAAHLQEMANIGQGMDPATGTATLYQPTTPEELAADLEVIIGGAVGCDLALNGEVTEGGECQGTVELNGTPLGCNEPDGWELADPRHIRLTGASCDQFMTSADGMLNARFPCDVFKPD